MKDVFITITSRSKDQMVARIIIHAPIIQFPEQESTSFTIQDLDNNQFSVRVEIAKHDEEHTEAKSK